MTAEPRAIRVRPHVARVVAPAEHVLLDLDGIMFDVRAVIGERREQAVADLLAARPYRPRPTPVSFCWGLFPTLEYLAAHEPDHAAEAEALVSRVERDAALAAAAMPGLTEVLGACAATGRTVAVVSAMCEQAVRAALRAHGLDGQIAAIAARQGPDLSTVDLEWAVMRAASLLDAPPATCLSVSGSFVRLSAARRAGAATLGCECGRDSRRWMADEHTPVVANLWQLSAALRG
ncbi:hypothetical protein CS0771_50590 [Catellatospora sp. IY07-71]|uniref:HAD family hydrolase n=1 Tax=Catellatospora sp. IY07-71 TaxID=2728827 RepID=UPI001BB33D84|nr:HAD family hydrolase [Catellatospora sp. IY07-71]BCJ75515.1 hypothetical protein CS0771_50590 [Catellatospora sp. IY07-71]